MKIEKQGDKKVVVTPEGEIDFTNSEKFKEEVLDLIKEGFEELVINFGKVDSIDSSGLGKLLLFHKELKDKGGKFKIVKVENEYIKKMFDMINLDQIIDIEL